MFRLVIIQGNVKASRERSADTLDWDYLTWDSGTPTCNTPKQLRKGLSDHSKTNL